MRLQTPASQHIESSDGTCSLTFEGYDQSPAQAGGGGVYLLRVTRPEITAELKATIQSTTGIRAEQQAKEDGLDPIAMRSSDIRKYREAYSDQFGASYRVILFDYTNKHAIHTRRDIANEPFLAEMFCTLFLRLKSLYRYNNPDYPNSGEGFYPDTVEYSPFGVDPSLIKTFAAAEVIHD